jgi:hypothetical protein
MAVTLNTYISGFGPLGVADFLIDGSAITLDPSGSIQDAILMRTVQGASTVTLQVSDPQRQILRAKIFNYGSVMTVDGLSFTAVQMTKASDTLQLVFEATGVAQLRLQSGLQVTSTSTNLTGFVASLVAAVPGLQLVSAPDPITTAISIGRGTTDDPDEDSWTCIQRVATSAGWRCFEVNGVIYLGPDSYFLAQPSLGTIGEWTNNTQNIDFDYDIGQPVGNATVTAISNTWSWPPGSVILTSGMGPMDGQPWLVQDCQRDLFSPQMTATLYVPMPPFDVINGYPAIAPF